MGLKFFFIHWHGVALRASQHKVALEFIYFFLKKKGEIRSICLKFYF